MPFPVFINTPYTLSTSTPGEYFKNGLTGCPALNYPPPYYGYASAVTHSVSDLIGNTLTPIDTAESLENRHWLYPSYSGAALPNPNPWPATGPNAAWTGNTFVDVLWICISGTSPSPQITSYSPSGGTELFNETQKLWVGTTTPFSGACVQRGVVKLYTNHGAITDYITPIVNRNDCNPGTTIN